MLVLYEDGYLISRGKNYDPFLETLLIGLGLMLGFSPWNIYCNFVFLTLEISLNHNDVKKLNPNIIAAKV